MEMLLLKGFFSFLFPLLLSTDAGEVCEGESSC